MKITTDVNTNIETISGSNTELKGSSILDTLFSIDINDKGVDIENNQIQGEFIFKDDDIKIIDYLSNFLSDIKDEDYNISNFNMFEKTIKLDKNLNIEEKNKVLDYLKLALSNFETINMQVFKNNSEQLQVKNSTKLNKNLESVINQNKDIFNAQKDKKIGNFSISHFGKNKSILNQADKIKSSLTEFKNKSEDLNKLEIANKTNFSFIEKNMFVKKVRKNNSPNKIYEANNFNNNQANQLEEISVKSGIKVNNSSIINNSISSQIFESLQKNKMLDMKNKENQNFNIQQSNQSNYSGSNFAQNNDSSFTNNGYNSVLENLLEHLDLTQKGWTSKLASRIEKALLGGNEEIEFNLKPKNLGVLKVSVSLNNGLGNVKIITENSFVTSALNQNENYLQKLFNDQGINLEFIAQNGSQYFGSKNNFNQNSKNNAKNEEFTKEIEIEKAHEDKDENETSRHMINVIA